MVTTLIITSAVLATLTLIFYAMHKIRPESFTFRASILKLFSFDLEMKLPEQKTLPAKQPKKLPQRRKADGARR